MKLAVSLLAAGFAICAIPPAMQAQDRPNFSDTWILDKQHSGPEKVVWNQTRSGRFTIEHSPLEVTIDTGDGSLFGVREPVTEGPLVYKLDGSAVIVIDRSLGDLPGLCAQDSCRSKVTTRNS